MIHSRQRGAVAPLVAIMLFVIIICVALVVDLGHVHNVKGQLQRAVDAAALAGARYLPIAARVSSVAGRVAGENTVDGQTLAALLADEPGSTELDIALGSWDKEALGSSPVDRWLTGGTPTSAVKVRAKRDVGHIFFFFLDSTEVVADAIALAEPINPVFPLSIISCIPLDSIVTNPGSLPGTDVCDIKYYSFINDTDDTAAWTGLTFGGGAPAITQFLDPVYGRAQFEKTIFTGLASTAGDGGLENAPPDPNASPGASYAGYKPVELNIPYGLGKIAGETLAPPESFPDPVFPSEEISRDPVTGVYLPYNSGTGPFDPMLDYNNSGALPRWYNLNDDGALKTDDHFVRVWSLDGHLLKGPIPGSQEAIDLGVVGESFVAYQARLKGYFEGTLQPPAPYNDGRLKSSTGLISNSVGNAEATAIAKYFTDRGEPVNKNDVKYWPDYGKIMLRAGYPKVNVTNGAVTTVLDAFFSNPEVANEDAETLNCSDNEPLSGQTLRMQVPVIFTGFCESWKAISNPSDVHNLVYVGLGDFLMTRGWKNPKEYDCPTPVTLAANNNAICSPFDPPLSGDAFSDIGVNDKGAEGLFKLPLVDEADAASLVRVFLVE